MFSGFAYLRGGWQFVARIYLDLPNTTVATGDYGHASATGDSGWAIGGYCSRVKANKNGIITAIYRAKKMTRPRVVVGYVGEKGIKADTWYEVKNGKFVVVKD